MNDVFDRLRFLWREEIAATEEVPRGENGAAAGIPRPLQGAIRFTLLGALAIGLMGQIIGVRLAESVDAAPSYTARCIQINCLPLQGADWTACIRSCAQ